MTEQISLIEQERRQEAEEAKKKAPRGKRSLELIADFSEDGCAKGWHFKVSKAFKDELDIKRTERKIPVLDENGKQIHIEARDKQGNIKYKKDGTPSMKKKTRPVLKWTQGKYFGFAEGQVIECSEYLCQIVRAVPVTVKDKQLQKGSVTFVLYQPNESQTGMDSKGQYHLNQDEFVEYLQTGILIEGAEDLNA